MALPRYPGKEHVLLGMWAVAVAIAIPHEGDIGAARRFVELAH